MNDIIDGPFTCSVCGCSYTLPRRTVNRRRQEGRLIDTICVQGSFKTRRRPVTDRSKFLEEAINKNPYTCSRCGKEFTQSKANIINRMTRKLPIDMCGHCIRETKKLEWEFIPSNRQNRIMEILNDNPYTCIRCGGIFDHSYTTAGHIVDRSRRIDMCGECSKHENFKETCLDRLGVDHPLKSSEVLSKCRETYLTNFGDHPSRILSIRKKIEKTTLERYGVKCVLSSPDMPEIRKEKTGFSYPSQNPAIRERSKETSRQTCQKLYGAPTFFGSEIGKQVICDRKIQNIISQPDKWTIDKNGGPCLIQDKFGNKSERRILDKISSKLYGPNKLYAPFNNPPEFTISWFTYGGHAWDMIIFKDISPFIFIDFDGLHWHNCLEDERDDRGVEKVGSPEFDRIRIRDLNRENLIPPNTHLVVIYEDRSVCNDNRPREDECIDRIFEIIRGEEIRRSNLDMFMMWNVMNSFRNQDHMIADFDNFSTIDRPGRGIPFT